MKKNYLIVIIFAFLAGCSVTKETALKHEVSVAFVQINDVYEIDALEGGNSGGMARVATIKDQVKAEFPNTLLVMAGDFLSPSIYNSLRIDGKAVRGKQMVEAMNVAGMDLVCFGNHEFDIRESELQERLNESNFEWISGNTFQNVQQVATPFKVVKNNNATPIPTTIIKTFKNTNGESVKIGFISVCLPFNKSNYVVYTDPLSTAELHYNQIKDQCDAVVAITHQAFEDDIELAKRLPNLALIMGGHEHDMRLEQVGNVWITKAHANSKSVFINTLTLTRSGKNISVQTAKPKLKILDASVPQQEKTQELVRKWGKIANANFESMGFNASRIIISKGDSLEGREAYVRSTTTNLTKIVVQAMEFAAPEAELVIVNSGSIRVDDVLKMPLSEYDIIRTLPYGGSIIVVEMKGKLLKRTLQDSEKNRGIGGFLQHSEKIKLVNDEFLINNEPIGDEKVYKVALTDFLLTGGEARMEYLTPENPDIIKVYETPTDQNNPKKDIRLAVIQFLFKK